MRCSFSWPTFTAAALFVGGVLSAACGEARSEAALAEDRNGVPGESSDGGGATSLIDDSATPKTAPYRGNPLCHILSTCVPDEVEDRQTPEASSCSSADGGVDAGASTVGCRLTSAGGFVSPECVSATASRTDGVSCSSGADCAPGFDCVESDKGSVCRRYCCLGSCAGQTSQNGGATFCDVQTLVDVNQKAPVCMPLKRCKLLSEGDCASSETCAVVDETGDAGCVGIGPSQVGQACDDTHCAAELICLGQAGNRKCYQLCRVSDSRCGPQQVCKTSTIFKDVSVGVCQSPP